MQEKRRIDFRYVILLLISAVLMTAGILFGTYGNSVRDGILQKQQDKINELTYAISQQQAANADLDNKVVYESTGVDTAKLEEDRRVIDQLCTTAFTWHSYLQYNTARDTLIDSYNIPEDCYFMQTFFPDMTEYGTADNNDIDAGSINCSYERNKIYLSDMLGSIYRYIVFVDFSSINTHYYESTSRACMMLTMDGQQNITEISAFTAY